MQSREEKQLDAGVEAIIQRINDLRQSIQAFIIKLETDYQTLEWKSMLASFSLISGQITLLSRFLKNEKMPNLKNYVLLPFHLAQVEDPNLKQLTEGRVPFCNHEVVPSYLRTKPEPEVEERVAQLQNKSNSLSQDNLQKQLNTFNKLATAVHETLKNSRETLEGDPVQKGMLMQVTGTNDTYNLVAAITNGRGLRANQSSSQSQHVSESRINIPQPQSNVMPNINVNKMTSSIKMNIKSGSSQHPYNR